MRTIGELLDRYDLEVVPTKAVSTHEQQAIWIRQLHRVFGKIPLTALEPHMVYRYVDERSKKKPEEVITKTGKKVVRMRGGKTTAHREKELLSHAFTKAVEWGYLKRHPFKGEVELTGIRSRDRYIEDWEIVEALALESRRRKGSVLAIQAYIRIKLMTGMARSDLLRLRVEHLKEDGIHIQRHKTADSTGKRTTYSWIPAKTFYRRKPEIVTPLKGAGQ